MSDAANDWYVVHDRGRPNAVRLNGCRYTPVEDAVAELRAEGRFIAGPMSKAGAESMARAAWSRPDMVAARAATKWSYGSEGFPAHSKVTR